MEEEIKKIVREEIARSAHTESDEILNANEAADFLRLKRPTIYDLKARGKIPFKKIGGKIVFIKSELLNWVKSGESAK